MKRIPRFFSMISPFGAISPLAFALSFALSFALPFALSGCVGSTGSGLVTFNATAHGPKSASPTSGYTFHTTSGWDVTLTRARMQIGAVYLNVSVPLSSERPTSCVLPGIYVGELTDGLVVDALDPSPQAFPVQGEGTENRAVTAEIWLGAPDVNANEDATVLLDVAGTAKKGSATIPFAGTITIGQNRAIPPENAALPGSSPLCQQRIISPIPVSLDLTNGGTLDVSIEPRVWFDGVDFGQLTQVSKGQYQFGDDSATQPDINLYMGFRSNTGAYGFAFASQ